MQPTRVIAVDWSGARTAEQKKIWLAEIAIGANSAERARLVRLCNGWTREAVTEELVRVVHASTARGERVVIGLDFSFGFPAWYAQRNGWRTGRDIWSAWTSGRVEQTLAEPAFPFWGRGVLRAKPGALRDDSDTPPLRTTECDNALRGPRPFSVFQLVGAGAVGVGSLRGMATLRALNNAGAAIWPFDECYAAQGSVFCGKPRADREPTDGAAVERAPSAIVLEIWPRLYAPMVNKSNGDDRLRHVRSLQAWDTLLSSQSAQLTPSIASIEDAISKSDDAFDALMGALAMYSARDELAQLPPVQHDLERLEGRIWRPATPLLHHLTLRAVRAASDLH